MDAAHRKALHFQDIVTADALNEMLESVFSSTGMRYTVLDETGTAISHTDVRSDLCRYATDRPEARDECQRCTQRAIQLAQQHKGTIHYLCHMGLACTILPIEIDGQCVAFLLFSGYRMEPEQMKTLPAMGASSLLLQDDPQLQRGLESAAVYSQERIQEISQVMTVAARYIASAGAHSLAQRQLHEKSLHLLLDENRRANERRLLSQAEYHAWQYQHNSHFLFNSLDLIQALAVLGRCDEIVDAAGALAALLRRNMNKNLSLVPLGEEIRYLRYFTSLIQGFYGECLRIEVRAQEDCLWLEIPPFSISAFVEYILFGSLYDKEEPSFLEVSLFRSGNGVDVTFLDNGTGLTEDELHAIHSLQGEVERDTSSSYEMADTLLRLRMHYGPRFYWSLVNQPNEQNLLRLHLPLPEDEL